MRVPDHVVPHRVDDAGVVHARLDAGDRLPHLVGPDAEVVPGCQQGGEILHLPAVRDALDGGPEPVRGPVGVPRRGVHELGGRAVELVGVILALVHAGALRGGLAVTSEQGAGEVAVLRQFAQQLLAGVAPGIGDGGDERREVVGPVVDGGRHGGRAPPAPEVPGRVLRRPQEDGIALRPEVVPLGVEDVGQQGVRVLVPEGQDRGLGAGVGRLPVRLGELFQPGPAGEPAEADVAGRRRCPDHPAAGEAHPHTTVGFLPQPVLEAGERVPVEADEGKQLRRDLPALHRPAPEEIAGGDPGVELTQGVGRLIIGRLELARPAGRAEVDPERLGRRLDELVLPADAGIDRPVDLLLRPDVLGALLPEPAAEHARDEVGQHVLDPEIRVRRKVHPPAGRLELLPHGGQGHRVDVLADPGVALPRHRHGETAHGLHVVRCGLARRDNRPGLVPPLRDPCQHVLGVVVAGAHVDARLFRAVHPDEGSKILPVRGVVDHLPDVARVGDLLGRGVEEHVRAHPLDQGIRDLVVEGAGHPFPALPRPAEAGDGASGKPHGGGPIGSGGTGGVLGFLEIPGGLGLVFHLRRLGVLRGAGCQQPLNLLDRRDRRRAGRPLGGVVHGEDAVAELVVPLDQVDDAGEGVHRKPHGRGDLGPVLLAHLQGHGRVEGLDHLAQLPDGGVGAGRGEFPGELLNRRVHVPEGGDDCSGLQASGRAVRPFEGVADFLDSHLGGAGIHPGLGQPVAQTAKLGVEALVLRAGELGHSGPEGEVGGVEVVPHLLGGVPKLRSKILQRGGGHRSVVDAVDHLGGLHPEGIGKHGLGGLGPCQHLALSPDLVGPCPDLVGHLFDLAAEPGNHRPEPLPVFLQVRSAPPWVGVDQRGVDPFEFVQPVEPLHRAAGGKFGLIPGPCVQLPLGQRTTGEGGEFVREAG